MDKTRSIIGWLVQVLCWVLLLLSTLILIAAVLVPRVTGSTPYTIATGSMEPAYPPGTLVVVKSANADKLQAGDVITYQLKSGEAAVVTHRIVGVGVSFEDETLFQTKGDANVAPDIALVREVQIRGKVWYHVPYVGYVSDLIASSHRSLINYVLIAGFALYALWQFWGAYRERRNGPAEPVEPSSDESSLPVLARGAAVASVVGMVVAALIIPTGAYWNSARQTTGTPVTSGEPWSCRVFNANNNSDIGGATCDVSLASCPQINGNSADVYLNVNATGVNGNAANRVIEFRTTLRGMGCNPPGLNWNASPNKGLAGGPLFTFSQPFTCSSLPVVTARIPYVNRGSSVLLGRLYYDKTGQTVSCT